MIILYHIGGSTLITEKQIIEALGQLIDPSNNLSLSENDGVRKVEYDAKTNKVNLVIGLADDKTPKLNDFQFEIMKKMKVELGIGGVKVEYVKQNTRSSQETNILRERYLI